MNRFLVINAKKRSSSDSGTPSSPATAVQKRNTTVNYKIFPRKYHENLPQNYREIFKICRQI